jgi:adenylate kinase
MMKERFTRDDAKGGVLLDGFPRTVTQARELDGIIAIDSCVNLVVAAEVIIDRVLARRVCSLCGAVHSTKTHQGNACAACGGELVTRADDNEETVRERFRVYEEQTAPLIQYYTDKGILADVDATMPIDREADAICLVLGEK